MVPRGIVEGGIEQLRYGGTQLFQCTTGRGNSQGESKVGDKGGGKRGEGSSVT